ncbi:MAG TPA: hypothetical protein VGI34_07320 [Candidatus Acidoferrales bacterium]
MTARKRKSNEFAGQAMPIVILGMALIASNRYVTFIDEEARSINAAAQSARTLLAFALGGAGRQTIPPLYGLVLHFWLRSTAWNFEYLRIPAIAFFIAGIFFVGRAAYKFSGALGATAAVWAGILWPFGFHYGRLAAPFAFDFFLVAGLTFSYLRYTEEDNFERWAALFLFGAALLWSNFLGWAVLACLAIDQALRRRAGERTASSAVLARTAILWLAAFIPVRRVFYGEFLANIHRPHSVSTFLAAGAFHIYNLFVSESVAPWHWQLSIPAGLAIVVCVALAFMNLSGPSRRFLCFGLGLLILMAAFGILSSGRWLLAAPWLLFPIAVAIASIESRWARPTMAVALLLIGGIGWYGIYARRFYSAPQFLEPWAQVAADAAAKIQTGANVVSNSDSFFLYLTFALRPPSNSTDVNFAGLLPDTLRHSGVKSAQQWLSSDHSRVPTMIWIHSSGDPATEGPMNAVAGELDHSCGSRISRLMSRDAGFAWRQRFLSQSSDSQWLIEVREYDCASSNSQEIYPIPAR